MNPPSIESIFLILSGVVLAAGVLYWFWSHIQLTQKKVQLLENAVFELRGMVTQSRPVNIQQEVVTEPVYNDLAEEEDWAPVEAKSTPLEELPSDDKVQASDDLAPGGGAATGLPEEEQSAEKFRELFLQPEHIPSPVKTMSVEQPATNESLEAMPVKELRRLAEQRGIGGVSDLKKKELLSALRQQITSVPVSVAATGKEVVVERTVDLTEVDDLKDAPVLE